MLWHATFMSFMNLEKCFLLKLCFNGKVTHQRSPWLCLSYKPEKARLASSSSERSYLKRYFGSNLLQILAEKSTLLLHLLSLSFLHGHQGDQSKVEPCLTQVLQEQQAAADTARCESQVQLRRAGAQQVGPGCPGQDSKQLLPIPIQGCFLKAWNCKARAALIEWDEGASWAWHTSCHGNYEIIS